MSCSRYCKLQISARYQYLPKLWPLPVPYQKQYGTYQHRVPGTVMFQDSLLIKQHRYRQVPYIFPVRYGTGIWRKKFPIEFLIPYELNILENTYCTYTTTVPTILPTYLHSLVSKNLILCTPLLQSSITIRQVVSVNIPVCHI